MGKKQGSWIKNDDNFKLIDGNKNKHNWQELPFMFEMPDPKNPKDDKKHWRMLLPLNPETYKMTYAPRVNMTMTQGGAFEDNIGISTPKFSISGVFGVIGTTVVGAAKSLDNEPKSGMELYHEMEKNLLQFYERFGQYRLDGKTQDEADKVDNKQLPNLRFYNFCDQEYWVVQINSFVLNRSTQRRHLYQYDIQMTGLLRLGSGRSDIYKLLDEADKAKKIRDGAIKAASLADSLSGWSKFMASAQGLVKGITGGINSALSVFNSIRGEVGKLQGMMTDISGAVRNFADGLTALVHAPMDLINTAVATTKSILASVDKIAGLPHEFVNDLRQTQRLLMGYQQQPQLFGMPATGINNTSIMATAGSGDQVSWGATGTTVSGVITDPVTGASGGAMGGTFAASVQPGAAPSGTMEGGATSQQPTYYTAPDGTVVLIPAGVDPATISYTAQDGSIQQVPTVNPPPADTQPPVYTNQEILTISIPAGSSQAQSTAMNPPEYTLLAPGQETVNQVAVAEVTITDSDTVATIAQKFGVDWKALVALNGLEYPYLAKSPADTITPALETAVLDNAIPAGDITFYSSMAAQPGEVLSYDNGRITVTIADAANGVITLENPLTEEIPLGAEISRHERKLAIMIPGDAINIPGSALNTGMILDNSASSLETRLLGIDEELDTTGAMTDNGRGDVATISGLSNLEMQLRHRIMTLRGELAELGHPEYGSLLPTFIGKINNSVWQARALLECQLSVMEDPRVASVQNVRFTADNTAIYFQGDVYPINFGSPTTISLPLA